MEHSERQARTRELARQICEAEGRPDGQELRHWGMAERLVDAEIASAALNDGRPAPGTEAAHGQP